MAATEWLLIGGPADGKKVMILLHEETLKWPTENGNEWLYQGYNYLHRGRVFRIGIIDTNDVEESKVARMIDETDLWPIDGA